MTVTTKGWSGMASAHGAPNRCITQTSTRGASSRVTARELNLWLTPRITELSASTRRNQVNTLTRVILKLILHCIDVFHITIPWRYFFVRFVHMKVENSVLASIYRITIVHNILLLYDRMPEIGPIRGRTFAFKNIYTGTQARRTIW